MSRRIVDHRHRRQPVEVVEHLRLGRTGREVEEALELWPERGRVVLDGRRRQGASARGLARGVADHAGAAADEHDRAATGALQMRQQEHLQQMPDVQRGSAGIEADVGADRAGREALFEAFGARWTRPRQPSSSSRAERSRCATGQRISLRVHPFMLATAERARLREPRSHRPTACRTRCYGRRRMRRLSPVSTAPLRRSARRRPPPPVAARRVCSGPRSCSSSRSSCSWPWPASWASSARTFVYSQRPAAPEQLEKITFPEDTIIYDRNGRRPGHALAAVASAAAPSRGADVPPILADAVTAVEDKTFWANTGIDPLGHPLVGASTRSPVILAAARPSPSSWCARSCCPRRSSSESSRLGDRKIKEIIQSVRVTDYYRGERASRPSSPPTSTRTSMATTATACWLRRARTSASTTSTT